MAAVAVPVLLALAGLTVVLSALGLATARAPLARLHFLTPVTSLAGPLTAVAYLVDQGPGLASGLVVATVGLLAVTGPPLGTAIGAVTADEEELLPPRSTR